ncbi:MAG: hypothetical protein ACLTAF_04540 [Blautia coccoides]
MKKNLVLQVHLEEAGRRIWDLLEQYEENEAYAEVLNVYIPAHAGGEALKRVWICYQGLPYRQRAVLKALYVEHKPWKVVRASVCHIPR